MGSDFKEFQPARRGRLLAAVSTVDWVETQQDGCPGGWNRDAAGLYNEGLRGGSGAVRPAAQNEGARHRAGRRARWHPVNRGEARSRWQAGTAHSGGKTRDEL